MRIYFSILCLFLSVGAQAAKIDRSVSGFLKARSNGRMEVIVLYAPVSGMKVLTPVDMQKFTREAETRILGYLRAARPAKTLWLARATRIELSRPEISRLAQTPGILSITQADRKAHLTTDYTEGLTKTGIPQLRQVNPELDGRGVKVGIIDTGIDPNHRDLAGKVLAFKNFLRPADKTPFDDHGHGTHVAGTVAGGESSGTAIGMAPGAKLIIAKTFSRYGGSEGRDLLESLQWVVDPDGNPSTDDGADIVSASWNIDDADLNQDPINEPFCVALQNLRNLGVIPIFSAGNDGPAASTVKIPGACPAALTVGATDDSDHVTEFSSRGPVRWKTVELMKPDIAAPGVDVYSAAAGGGYAYKSGTSMSTPHVAGALAIMRQAFPRLSAEDLENRLLESARDVGKSGMDSESGFGRLDILKATR